MSQGGNYPFVVNVTNFFLNKANIILKVTHHCYEYDYIYEQLGKEPGKREKDFPDPNKKISAECLLHPGEKYGFYLYWGDEFIEISIANPEDLPCYPEDSDIQSYEITTGISAKVYLEPEEEGKWDIISLKLKEKDNEKKTFYVGGIFTPHADNKNWKVTIKKYNPDPASDDVTVGPEPPA